MKLKTIALLATFAPLFANAAAVGGPAETANVETFFTVTGATQWKIEAAQDQQMTADQTKIDAKLFDTITITRTEGDANGQLSFTGWESGTNRVLYKHTNGTDTLTAMVIDPKTTGVLSGANGVWDLPQMVTGTPIVYEIQGIGNDFTTAIPGKYTNTASVTSVAP
ncbi:hypothetical protein [Edwardsiella tarda]